MKIAAASFTSRIQGGKLAVTVATVVTLVTMEIDVGLLSDPDGGAVGRAWTLDREEFISQVAPPDKTK